MSDKNEEWDLIVKPKNSIFNVDLQSFWHYRDLLLLFVKRDFIAVYKQTVLGPLWYIIQPLLTTFMFTVIFGQIAKIPTDGIPKILFYLSGVTMWTYFAECLNKTSNTFISNSTIFGKVYFPRLIVPVSIIISNLITFAVQFLLFILVLLYYFSTTDLIHPNIYILLLPLLILIMAGTGLGLGIIISSLTTKYRDLRFLIAFGVQLFMFATPVIYPMSFLSAKQKVFMMANPLSAIMETFRFAFTGVGVFNWMHLLYSFICMLILLFIGIILFNKVEKTFMDTV
ncbi:MAG: putative polysaccharide transporter permease protein [Bacteroidota bacterium]|jgi:lipopolysaccharide transport system permease protein|nr:putative polysaccharide transporter permease protein [Bacteroidota bacterium]